ncbi:hypothetical protein O1611_g6759 [Lasiodiplodia mahajangana]|uniref:Uncharacterized protein n=1 Tax=Lasiodiplodia mahajangana TaxID=1108764 RepID=A0ACC2JI61_9PEZI|nr:hypothetical protein O1611_g6759 [Lasiodiplodia mahajangana]
MRRAQTPSSKPVLRSSENPGTASETGGLEESWRGMKLGEKLSLYQGIFRLGEALGLTDSVLDTPTILERIVNRVTASNNAVRETPQITILTLRIENSRAQVQIETLRRRLERAQLGKTEDEVKTALRAVDEAELERRVTVRTQTYREHRGAILTHLFQAQAEFMNLAAGAENREAIEALVDRFLQPASLPMIQLPANHDQRQR